MRNGRSSDSSGFAGALLITLLLGLVTPTDAARLFTCGYEENENSTLTMWDSVVGTVATDTAQKHSGTYSDLHDGAGSLGDRRRDLATAKTTGSLFTRLYFRHDGATPVSANRAFLRWQGSGGNAVFLYFNPNTDELLLQNAVTATLRTFTTTPSANTWYRIELDYVLHETAGSLEARLYTGDETTALETETITGEDTIPTDVTGVRIGNIAQAAWGIIWIDSVGINDESGAFQNSNPGPGKIALIKPATVVSAQWEDGVSGSPGAGDTNATNLDDLPGTPDDDTTFNQEDDTLNQVDRLTATALPAEVPSNADMILLDAYARVGSPNTTTKTMRLKVWDEGSTLTNGPDIVIVTSGYRKLTTTEHQVFDLGARSKANVNDFDLGYENITDDATRLRKITALWANVEWREGSGGGQPPRSIHQFRQRRTERHGDLVAPVHSR